jgi:uncharacterized coiled-coil protein SlyX
MMNPDEESRLNDLEIRYSYLERAVRDLDQVVIDLRAQVDRLEREMKELVNVAGEEEASPENEKPPHY